jgi:hypothetical protein
MNKGTKMDFLEKPYITKREDRLIMVQEVEYNNTHSTLVWTVQHCHRTTASTTDAITFV